jgi:hypothetical protein
MWPVAKLPPKFTLPPPLVDRLRAEVEKLLPIGERLHADLAGMPQVVERLRAKRPPRKKAKRSRRELREQVKEVVRELWPRGVPARSRANPNWKLLSRLRPALKKRGIPASDDTMLRALGRRPDPKKRPMK